MTEQEALSKLGAKDWRSLNKNQIMSFFFETAPNLSDEVRLKILESAPYILNTVQDVINEYQTTAQKTLDKNSEVVSKILDQNHDATRAIFICYHEAAETLKGLLSDPNSSFEEKKYWNAELFRCLREMREHDRENKQFFTERDKENKGFMQNLMKYGIPVCLGLGIAVISLTGGKIKFPFTK